MSRAKKKLQQLLRILAELDGEDAPPGQRPAGGETDGVGGGLPPPESGDVSGGPPHCA